MSTPLPLSNPLNELREGTNGTPDTFSSFVSGCATPNHPNRARVLPSPPPTSVGEIGASPLHTSRPESPSGLGRSTHKPEQAGDTRSPFVHFYHPILGKDTSSLTTEARERTCGHVLYPLSLTRIVIVRKGALPRKARTGRRVPSQGHWSGRITTDSRPHFPSLVGGHLRGEAVVAG